MLHFAYFFTFGQLLGNGIAVQNKFVKFYWNYINFIIFLALFSEVQFVQTQKSK